MAENIEYRTLVTHGDTFSWVAATRIQATNWDPIDTPELSAWDGQIALTPHQGSSTST